MNYETGCILFKLINRILLVKKINQRNTLYIPQLKIKINYTLWTPRKPQPLLGSTPWGCSSTALSPRKESKSSSTSSFFPAPLLLLNDIDEYHDFELLCTLTTKTIQEISTQCPPNIIISSYLLEKHLSLTNFCFLYVNKNWLKK